MPTVRLSLLIIVIGYADVIPTAPEDGNGRILFVIIGLAIVGLYFLLRRTKNRALDDYVARRRREQELRDSDPDMK